MKVLVQPLRVTNCLVAVLAYTDKIALLVAVGVLIPDIQCLVRCVLDMIDMMHQFGALVSAALLADLALVLIHVKHAVRQPDPLRRAVEWMHVSGRDQRPEPIQKCFGHIYVPNNAACRNRTCNDPVMSRVLCLLS